MSEIKGCYNCQKNTPYLCYILLNTDPIEDLKQQNQGYCKEWYPIDPIIFMKHSLLRSEERQEQFGRDD